MSCDTGRIPTIKEYCDHRIDHVPYADDIKPESCYSRVENEDGDPTMVLDGVDWGVIGGYFAIVLGTGLGISFYSQVSKSPEEKI